jgi:AcrR family transcriptional regulator
VPRSGEQARQRLQQAALELYLERGYDATTAAQIAERAGVTERTFFRHFADKREVLFDGEAKVRDDLARGVAEAAAGLDPLAVLAHAFTAVIPLLEGNRPFAEPRNQVIATTPQLRERALIKEAVIISALTEALVRRGVSERLATLSAQIGMAAFTQATLSWFGQPNADLAKHLTTALDDVRALAATQLAGGTDVGQLETAHQPPPSRSSPCGDAAPDDYGGQEKASAPKRRRSAPAGKA